MPFIYLGVTFFVLALLGIVTLAILPSTHVSIGNLLLFVLGGLIGAIVFVKLGTRLLGALLQSLQVHSTKLHRFEWYGYLVLFVGAEFGGLVAVYLRGRLHLRRAPRP